MTVINKQEGMALITVLLATALIAVLAIGMTSAQQIAIKRTSNLVESDQAMLLALGLEEWAIQLLLNDRQRGGNDHFAEDWALTLMPTATENGVVSGHIIDLKGRVNLNNIKLGTGVIFDQTSMILTGLFDLCEVEDNNRIIQALADWLDKDKLISPGGGAEDNEYLQAETPYLTANRQMTSPSELLLVAGVSAENYACLSDHVTALEPPSTINLNTTSAKIISALSDKISLADAEEIVKDRPEDGYQHVADFLAHPSLAGSTIATAGLDLKSSYFLVQGQANFGDSEIRLNTIVDRSSATVKILSRSIGTY